ncbi:hypothetical protein PP459_gp032 [Streptomyces phage Wakanda]|uniref:Uncharacterized protein n=1 Tax=Streptomyces phage Wakanda TaxID=2713267 RepID=A0A6G8R209_9CAUD|nr:hypothetical protein PP459_gp032 [Streptomyces phage Wakanda]QIN94201.1 hypothetical protein SEA_WAKANDA_241 [Streptomyces phage Wakanda]
MSVVGWAAKAFVKMTMQLPFLPPTQRRQLYEFLMSAPDSVKREAAKTLLDRELNK